MPRFCGYFFLHEIPLSDEQGESQKEESMPELEVTRLLQRKKSNLDCTPSELEERTLGTIFRLENDESMYVCILLLPQKMRLATSRGPKFSSILLYRRLFVWLLEYQVKVYRQGLTLT